MSKKEKQNETPQQEPAVEEQDVKRLLSVYYQQDVTTDRFEDCDGERGVMDRG